MQLVARVLDPRRRQINLTETLLSKHRDRSGKFCTPQLKLATRAAARKQSGESNSATERATHFFFRLAGSVCRQQATHRTFGPDGICGVGRGKIPCRPQLCPWVVVALPGPQGYVRLSLGAESQARPMLQYPKLRTAAVPCMYRLSEPTCRLAMVLCSAKLSTGKW